MKKILCGYWPTMIVLAVILYATFASSPVMADELPSIPHLDKLIHAVMMGGLLGAFTFDWQRSHRTQYLGGRIMLTVLCGVLMFSVLDELVQNALDNQRQGDILDFVADAAGAIVAFFTAPPAVRKVLGLKKAEQR